jgi:hypothetical protein
MKIQYLIIFLIMEIFVSEGQAMSPKKGGASGQDISSCKIDYKGNGKVSIQKEREKPSLMCVGKAICGGKEIPVSCSLPSESATCDQARSCSPLSTGAELPRGTVLKAEKTTNFINFGLKSKKDSKLNAYIIEFFNSPFLMGLKIIEGRQENVLLAKIDYATLIINRYESSPNSCEAILKGKTSTYFTGKLPNGKADVTLRFKGADEKNVINIALLDFVFNGGEDNKEFETKPDQMIFSNDRDCLDIVARIKDFSNIIIEFSPKNLEARLKK